MSDIWNEKNTVCWSPTKFIKEMNKLQALNAELEAELGECVSISYYETMEKVYEEQHEETLRELEAQLAALREALESIDALGVGKCLWDAQDITKAALLGDKE